MARTLRIVGLGAAGLLALWVLLEVVVTLFGLVAWIVNTVVSIAVFALLLYLGYVVLSSLRS